MNPKKAKIFIPEVARELDISEDVVSAVVVFYWGQVRKSMSALSSPRIHLTNLGDMTIKHWCIDNKIDFLKKWEENNKQKGLQHITGLWNNAELLFNLQNAKKMFTEEQQRKDFIKLHKKSYGKQIKKQYIPDMEKQGDDSGGDKK